jgi:hypothetical protein
MAVRLRVLKKCACELLSFGIDLVKTSNRNGYSRLFAFCCFAYSIQVSSRCCFSGSAKDDNESVQVFSRGCFLGLPRVRMDGGIQTDFLRQFMLSPDPCPGRIVQIQSDISVEHASFSGAENSGIEGYFGGNSTRRVQLLDNYTGGLVLGWQRQTQYHVFFDHSSFFSFWSARCKLMT